MSLFGKKKPRNPIQIEISAPDSVTQDDIFLAIQIGLSCEAQTVHPVVTARLRADITEKRKARSAAQFYLLGEASYQGQVDVVPGQPTTLDLQIPLDFSPMALFDIPTANMSMATPEMQAAMNSAQEIKNLYTYSVEVITKTDEAEASARRSIELIHPQSTRVGSF